MVMPWNKKAEKKIKGIERDLEANNAQLEAFTESLKNARKGVDDLLSELIQIKKDGRNGDH